MTKIFSKEIFQVWQMRKKKNLLEENFFGNKNYSLKLILLSLSTLLIP